jgi:hypothetical protein
MKIGIATKDAIGQTARVILSGSLNGAIGEVVDVLSDGILIAVKIDGTIWDIPCMSVIRYSV